VGALALVVVGAAIAALGIVDALDTLVSNRVRWPGGRRVRLLWLTDAWLTLLWRVVASIGRRIRSERRREALLSTFAPVGLLTLVLVWLGLVVLGFGLIWWALADRMSGVEGLGDALYFSGVVQLTVGFGEIVPLGGGVRALALLQAALGVLVTAMVIGFLPSLYGAYAERERMLLRLDDLSDDRLTPIGLLRSWVVDGDRSEMERGFEEWERWTALVLESHLTYPMLMWFRSQQRGQSWITGLGVVLDAATMVIAASGERTGPAMRMYRRGTRAIDLLSRRIGLAPVEGRAFTNPEVFAAVLESMRSTGLVTRTPDLAYPDAVALRAPYTGRLEALIDVTLSPRGFWPSGGPVPDALLQPEIPIQHVDRPLTPPPP
jgi:hypothetical protein